MRIIAGQWRSRRLVWPKVSTTRPMPDRIRQALFDRLGAYYHQPGTLPPLQVADVFAGSGSMGLEALSRGASSCCFFEAERDAIKILQQNIQSLDAAPLVTIECRDAWSAASTRSAIKPFDLLFLDPPYAQSQDLSPHGKVGTLLESLARHPSKKQLVVLHVKKTTTVEIFASWRMLDQHNYGSHIILMLERENGEAA